MERDKDRGEGMERQPSQSKTGNEEKNSAFENGCMGIEEFLSQLNACESFKRENAHEIQSSVTPETMKHSKLMLFVKPAHQRSTLQLYPSSADARNTRTYWHSQRKEQCL
ncbi:hypothetical protein V1477_005936 [Vespula maculifrons]|uniref:Uncharacterized protein n=2 Tax=Vespula TaxID=7451 RepID=A0A834JG17_VESVU|nr:hypothetical protein HZH66_010553 [Vespula vulgaris]